MYGLTVEENLIILATSGGVIAYDRMGSKNLPIYHQHELKGVSIRFRDVQRENANTWWVTTDHGLFELVRTATSFVLRRPPLITDPDIRNLSLRNYLKDGTTYWFGTYGEGLIKYDIISKEKNWFRLETKKGAEQEVINKIVFDRDKNILVCHDNGMAILEKGLESFEYFYSNGEGSRLSNRYVYDVYDDGKKLWIGTFGGGMTVMDKKTKEISYLTTREGLCDDAIYTITAENDSILWLGTNKGLARLNTRTKVFRNFEKNDGMPSEEFNMLSAYRDKRGEIFMGTVAGLISFYPSALTKNLLLPGVYLTRIRKNGTYIGDSAVAVINRDQKIVTKFGEDLFLEFSPMTFYGVSKPELTFRIRQQGDEWLKGETGGLLPLVKFEPGVYTIDIRMKSYSGSESSPVWTLAFTVLPPFWKTIGFRILAFLFLLMILYQVVRQIIKRRLERQRAEFLKQQAVEQERSRISAELHDDIGGGLTAIRLLSEMSLEHDTHHPTSKYLEKISASSNELIQKMNEIVWALNINNDNLQSLIAYTRQYAVSYLDDLNISCNFETPENIPDVIVNGKNRRSVFLLVKESLNNIAKHAHASNVNIMIDVSNALLINISDNGKGIGQENITKGNGLNNMRKRIQSMRGKMEILNDGGTTLVFNIPLKNLNA
jgi:signal transduction histidine kinase